MRNLIYRLLTHRTGFHVFCLAVFVPSMLLFRMGIHWARDVAGIPGIVLFAAPVLGACMLFTRWADRRF